MKILLIFNSLTINYKAVAKNLIKKIDNTKTFECNIDTEEQYDNVIKIINERKLDFSMYIIFDACFTRGNMMRLKRKIELFEKFNKKIFVAETGGESLCEEDLNNYKSSQNNKVFFGKIHTKCQLAVVETKKNTLKQVEEKTISKIKKWKDDFEAEEAAMFNFLLVLKRRNAEETLPKVPRRLLLWLFQKNFHVVFPKQDQK